jgi:hypothetical protein
MGIQLCDKIQQKNNPRSFQRKGNNLVSQQTPCRIENTIYYWSKMQLAKVTIMQQYYIMQSRFLERQNYA